MLLDAVRLVESVPDEALLVTEADGTSDTVRAVLLLVTESLGTEDGDASSIELLPADEA